MKKLNNSAIVQNVPIVCIGEECRIDDTDSEIDFEISISTHSNSTKKKDIVDFGIDIIRKKHAQRSQILDDDGKSWKKKRKTTIHKAMAK